MGEIVDTNAFPLFPTGKREFYIENVRKRQAKNDPSIKFYSWKLSTSIDGDTMTKDILMFRNQMGPFLMVFGCKEIEPGRFDVDWDEIIGKWFQAIVTHELDRKGILKEAFTEVGLLDCAQQDWKF